MLRRVELDSRQVLNSSLVQIEERMHASEDRISVSEDRMPTRGIPTYEDTPTNDFPISTPIVRGLLSIYELERIVTLEGVELDLTPKEYELLLLLASHPGRAFSREFLLQQLWGYDYDGFDRTVDTHITRLRKKLGAPGEKIVTVWGVGYRFVS